MNHVHHPFGPGAIRMAFSSARAQGRCALITYLTLGYPSRAESLELIPALQTGGADIIELGVPFSDPVADGPTIQRASQAAIEAGMTPSGCLELAAQLRKNGVTVPLVLMGYYNPIFSYGLAAYARDAASAGVDGLIVPDLPPEEAEPLQSACRNDGLALIFLVAHTSDKARIAKIAEATVCSGMTRGGSRYPYLNMVKRCSCILRSVSMGTTSILMPATHDFSFRRHSPGCSRWAGKCLGNRWPKILPHQIRRQERDCPSSLPIIHWHNFKKRGC